MSWNLEKLVEGFFKMRILTFDIEDWFHILDNMETQAVESWSEFESRIDEGVDRILEALDRVDAQATFFCLGWIAEKYPSVIRRIINQGFEIGSHSFAHQLVYSQNRAKFKEDLDRSIASIEEASGQKVRMFRAPGFSITENSLWAFDELVERGIEIDCSIFPAPRAHGGLPGFDFSAPARLILNNDNVLRCFPINTLSILGRKIVYSGGGYFRLLPWWYLDSRFSRDNYVMTYFHPRDFDADQPLVPGLSLARRFKSYVGLGGAMNKLEKLLDKYDFVSVGQAHDQIDWATTVEVDVK